MNPEAVDQRAAPTYPKNPPKPATPATARRGKVSETRVYWLDENPWWPANASPSRATLNQALPVLLANITGITVSAETSSTVLRARFTVAPRRISVELNHPPVTAPTSAIR